MPTGKNISQVTQLDTTDSLSNDDLLLVWDSGSSQTFKVTLDEIATVSGTKGGFSFSGGFARRGDPISYPGGNQWLPLDLDATVQATVDAPWWPGAAPSNGIDLFGGTALPYNVTRIFDFDQAWSTAADTAVLASLDGADITNRTGTLRFDELDAGTTNMIRIDMLITPQIANTTIDVGLWFQPKSSLDGANDGGAFQLPGSPLFFGTGTVGVQYLARPTTTMYIASDSDRFAYAALAIRADNPIIIDPQSCLVQNLR
jgi:hypothetical protein